MEQTIRTVLVLAFVGFGAWPQAQQLPGRGQTQGTTATASQVAKPPVARLGNGVPSFEAAPSAQRYATGITATYEESLNETYLKLGGWEGKLDVYARKDIPGPHPTLIYFHGGGPIGAASRKEWVTLDLLSYLEWGWNVVNVEYDIPGRTLAPVAVQNGLCALRWIVSNAKKFDIDTSKLVTSGFSSGGWMALMMAMTPRTPGWDQPCPGTEAVRVAAVVNWSGQTDFLDVLEGPNLKPWAAGWFQSLPNRTEIGKAVSPLTLVRAGLPPVMSIHGNADAAVPYSHSVRLHENLKRVGVPEELVTVQGGHGGYPRSDQENVFAAIKRFLTTHGAMAKR